MITLLVATRNAHKVEEIRTILGDSFRYQTLNDFPGMPKIAEDADSFAGNATKKAVELAHWLEKTATSDYQPSEGQLFVLADDSGLEVDVLDGAPGVHSARYAALNTANAGNSSDAENNAKLLRLLRDVPMEKRTARFRCVLALVPVSEPVTPAQRQDCHPTAQSAAELFEGVCEGWIGFTPRGNGGFGYDPLFIPESHHQTFAELGEEVKNQLSHRGQALAKLQQRLSSLARRQPA